MAKSPMNILFHMSAPSQTGPLLSLSVLRICSSVKLPSLSSSFSHPLLFFSPPPQKTYVSCTSKCKASPFESVLLDHRVNKHPCQEKAIWGPSLSEPELSWETHSSYNGQRRPFVESLGAAGLALDQTGVCECTFLRFTHAHARASRIDTPE